MSLDYLGDIDTNPWGNSPMKLSRLLKLSQLLVRILEFLPLAMIKPIAFKYVAGEDSHTALQKTQELNNENVKGTLDILGESVYTERAALAYTDQYIVLVKDIIRKQIASGVSVKPTALGLCVSYELAFANFSRLIEVACKHEIFVRIDMENATFTDDTIRLYNELKAKYSRVGIVYQAYLKRTLDDIQNHTKNELNVRICKGIYKEPEEIAYQGYQEIVDNYVHCLELAFEQGAFVAIATHDKVLVDAAKSIIAKHNIPKDKYEFQMLYGVLPNLRSEIKNTGHPIRVYVPYGVDWHPYSIRRMYENPMVAFYVAKAMFVDTLFFNLRRLIESTKFEKFVISVIILNAFTLGLETIPSLSDENKILLTQIDQIFLGFFIIELLTKMIVYRLRFFTDPWRIFDFLVVGIALFPSSGPFSVLRAMRILRTLRMVSVVPSLKRVVNSLLQAIPGLGAVGTIMSILFYIGAVMATKLFGHDFPQWFGTIGESAYSLFQIMTLESWSMGIVRPVMEEKPYAWLFFVPFILSTTFVMLNLFIAVIVNSMQAETETAAEERAERSHEERVEMLNELKRLRQEVSALKQKV